MTRWHGKCLGLLFVFAVASGAGAGDADSYVYVAPEDLGRYWVATKKVAPRHPRARDAQGCVSLAFVIESDGSTSHHVALAVWPSMGFTESAIEAAKKYQYHPAEENADRQAVLTFETFTYLINFDRSRAAPEDEVLLSTTCAEAAVEKLGEMIGGGD